MIIRALAVLSLLAAGLAGCATSGDTILAPGAAPIHAGSAYLVIHSGNSHDMDKYITEALNGRGLAVTTGAAESPAAPTDLVVKYADNWFWDLTMYLRTLDITFYDGRSGKLIATGSWANSAFHGYHSAQSVVNTTIDQMFNKLNGVNPPKTTSSPNAAK